MAGFLKHPLRVALIVAIAAATHLVRIELPGQAQLTLAPFIYLPLVLVLPLPWATAAAFCAMLPTAWYFNYPVVLALAVAEALWLRGLGDRLRLSTLITGALFWTVAGGPFAWLMYGQVADLPRALVWILVTKTAINHLAALAMAIFLVRQTRLADWLEHRATARPRMRETVFQSVFILALVSLGAFTVGISTILRRQVEAENRAILRATVVRSAQQMESFLENHRAVVTVAGRLLSGQNTDPQALLDETRRAHPEFITMLIADADGRITHWSANQPASPLNFGPVADRDYFRMARDTGRPYVSGVFRGRGFGRDILMAISAPVYDQAGRFAGVIEGSIEVQDFGRNVALKAALQQSALIIADAAGRVIYADEDACVPPLADLRHYPQHEVMAQPAGGQIVVFDQLDRSGVKTMYSATQAVAHSGARVIAQRPTLASMQYLSWVYLMIACFALGFVAIAALVARATNRRLAVSLEFFSRSAGSQAARRVVEPIENPVQEAPYEIQMVFRAFNQLAVQLRGTHELLRQQNAELDRRVAERTREAEEARRQAEAASQSKTDFLAMTGHEIRTPLNAIIGLADSVAEKSADPVATERLKTISRSGSRLLGVVNDLLDLSKVEAGRLDLHPAAVELGALCGEVQALFELRARQQGLSLSIERHPNVPMWVEVDGPRLQQVLINLVGNALKFTRQGGIRLQVTVAHEAPDGVTLRFAVVDTGPGIPADQQARLFQPYVQLPGAGQSTVPGTGLGLAISRRLVELFGGALALRSTVGVGTEFFFSFVAPRAVPPVLLPPVAPAVVAPAPAASAGLRVLAADDNLANQEVLRSILEVHCAHVEVVDGGEAALAALRRERFDAALIDLEMPDLDGYTVVQRVRAGEAGEAARGCRVIAFSAYGREQAWSRCREAGFDDFVEKPINRKLLLAAVRGEALSSV